MQHLRIGSTVSLSYHAQFGTSDPVGVSDAGVVTNITDSYLEFQEAGGSVFAVSWASIFYVTVTTD